ncbi:MAG: ferrous iron transport protein A [Gemmatimonadaceae bacterium]|nr:ferrous iron transport protein A [Gemmatimonadaceae bacterium]MCC6430599.1 ferrous iron transport protein A [Gemmatimonadaceae bacterium]
MASQLPTLDQQISPNAQRTCALAACRPGSRATVVDIGCATDEACRLRALGLCEGTDVSVIDARHAMLLDVRGTRLALGSALTAGIMVQPLPARG